VPLQHELLDDGEVDELRRAFEDLERDSVGVGAVSR